MNNNDLVAHPLAEHFPLVAGADYDRLRTAIRVSGQQEAIVLYEGRILSGRARYKICRDLQRQPLLTEWTDEMGPALEKVIKDNIAARELSKPTRAAIAAGLMSKDEKEIDKTLAHFGRMFNVSPHSIRYAGIILKQGTDRERELLAAGKLSISPVAIESSRGGCERARQGAAAGDRATRPDAGGAEAGGAAAAERARGAAPQATHPARGAADTAGGRAPRKPFQRRPWPLSRPRLRSSTPTASCRTCRTPCCSKRCGP